MLSLVCQLSVVIPIQVGTATIYTPFLIPEIAVSEHSISGGDCDVNNVKLFIRVFVSEHSISGGDCEDPNQTIHRDLHDRKPSHSRRDFRSAIHRSH